MEQANPVLVEVLRGSHVESMHRGSYCISDMNGVIIGQAGDIATPVFPRSTVKLIQAIPLVETGAAQYFDFTSEELALTCASHNGEATHSRLAHRILDKIQLSESDLACGSHWPMSEKAGRTLAALYEAPCQLHNNCSGKHAGFLAFLKYNKINIKNYTSHEHPMQVEIRKTLENVMQVDLTHAPMGIDGCAIPTWAISLHQLAHGFARLSAPTQHFDKTRAKAIQTLTDAVFDNPYMIAGEDRYDTKVMQGFNRKIFVKIGAEGVFTAFLPEQKIGIAVKCDDGSFRGAENILTGLLIRYNLIGREAFVEAGLENLLAPLVLNRNAETVGVIKPL
ncbi:MAG: asparaginase [Pseudomonadota bacterium]|nr:asparaginase [Pseudomonadota bacterium]